VQESQDRSFGGSRRRVGDMQTEQTNAKDHQEGMANEHQMARWKHFIGTFGIFDGVQARGNFRVYYFQWHQYGASFCLLGPLVHVEKEEPAIS
jgi:hypothetical protein